MINLKDVEFVTEGKLLSKVLFLLLLLIILFSVINVFYPHFLWDHFELVDYPLHATVEALGAIAAIILAFMPLSIIFVKFKPSYVFFSLAFFSMGIWDLFHSFMTISHGFVFSHSIALLSGGFFFALSIFPWGSFVVRSKWVLMSIVLVASLLLLLPEELHYNIFPEMIQEGRFTYAAKSINIIAGVLFIIGSVHLALIYFSNRNIGILIIIFVSVISAIVGITFQYSEAWSDNWWLWHFFRLIAFLAVLGFTLYSIQKISRERNNMLEYSEKQNKLLLDIEERYNLAIDASNIGIWDWDVPANEVYFSPVWKKQVGYRDDELENKFDNWVWLLHPDDKDRCLKAVDDFLKKPEGKFILEFRFKHKDGHYVWIHNEASAVLDEKGTVVRMFGAHADITKRKNAEQELKTSEEKFRSFFNFLSIPLCFVREDGTIESFNEKFTSLLGYTKEDIPTLNEWWVLAYPDEEYRKWVINNWEEAVQRSIETGGEIKSDIYDVSCKNGEIRQIIIAGITIGTDFLATFIDITDVRRAEEAIHKEKEFTDSVINAMPGIFYLFDQDGKFIKWNKTLADMSGFSFEEVGTKSPLDFIAPYDRDKIQQAIMTAFTEGEVYVEADFLAKDSKNVPFYFTGIRIVKDDQTLLLGVGIDISELKIAQQERENALEDLQRSNKELEQFAYVASHDLQEPLRMITSYTQLLERKYKGQLDENADKYIYFAVDAAKRMQRLINDLLSYSRISTKGEDFVITDLNEVMKNVLDQLNVMINETQAEIRYGRLPFLKADTAQVERLFLNLINNAIKYRKKDQKALVEISATEKEDSWEFMVKDNGIGIEKEYSEKVFVIFKRLHGLTEYPGTGIGLAICKQIVQRHGGEIWLESEEGKGCTFIFTLMK